MIEIDLNLSMCPSHGWAYEHAFATGFLREIRYEENNPLVDKLHKQFCEAMVRSNGRIVGVDNKQTFCAHFGYNNTPLYFTFHDNNLYIGTGVRPYYGSVLCEPDYKAKEEQQ